MRGKNSKCSYTNCEIISGTEDYCGKHTKEQSKCTTSLCPNKKEPNSDFCSKHRANSSKVNKNTMQKNVSNIKQKVSGACFRVNSFGSNKSNNKEQLKKLLEKSLIKYYDKFKDQTIWFRLENSRLIYLSQYDTVNKEIKREDYLTLAKSNIPSLSKHVSTNHAASSAGSTSVSGYSYNDLIEYKRYNSEINLKSMNYATDGKENKYYIIAKVTKNRVKFNSSNSGEREFLLATGLEKNEFLAAIQCFGDMKVFESVETLLEDVSSSCCNNDTVNKI